MELIVISGFLGSGKTTLLLSLAKAFVAQGRKVAIIENEVGKTGVDGEFLKAEGLSVREIYSGCICCSLRIDLIQTLLSLEREVKPDVVFLEPSGVAGPKQIQDCLRGYGGEIEKQTMISVADAKRLPAIRDFSMPLIHDGIEIADLVVINKTDMVTSDELADLRQRISAVNPAVDVLCISATQGNGIEDLIRKIVARDAAEVRAAEDLSAENELPKPAVFSASVTVDAPGPDAVAQIENFLFDLGLQFPPHDGALIGHLKAIVKTEPTGYAVFSVTGHNQLPVRNGKLPSVPAKRMSLTVNAIVYGTAEGPFWRLCRKNFRTLEALLRGN
jgi:G3E family GTPase